MHQSLRNNFGRTIWYSWVKRLKWKLGLVSLEIVLILIERIKMPKRGVNWASLKI